jgi:hypothetical protein
MADWNGPVLRRRLDSAERLSEAAMAFGLFEKTFRSKSSALLSFVTREDHFSAFSAMFPSFNGFEKPFHYFIKRRREISRPRTGAPALKKGKRFEINPTLSLGLAQKPVPKF